MNKVKLMIWAAVAFMALASCSKEDVPVIQDEPVVNIDNPQEEVTDQPAAAR